MAATKPLVTITGITGFVGSQVCMAFLNSEKFRVRGTVRSKDNAAKIDPLKKAFGDAFEEIELVEADLLQPETIMEACKGSEPQPQPPTPNGSREGHNRPGALRS